LDAGGCEFVRWCGFDVRAGMELHCKALVDQGGILFRFSKCRYRFQCFWGSAIALLARLLMHSLKRAIWFYNLSVQIYIIELSILVQEDWVSLPFQCFPSGNNFVHLFSSSHFNGDFSPLKFAANST